MLEGGFGQGDTGLEDPLGQRLRLLRLGRLVLLVEILEVLPVSSTFTKIEGEKGAVAEAANDFDALENLRRLMFAATVPQPEQLKIWET